MKKPSIPSVAVAFGCLAAGAGFPGGALCGCSGTTGREGLGVTAYSSTADASGDGGTGDAAGPDATLDAGPEDSGDFDVVIVYADAARLPRFEEAGGGEAGSEAGPPWDTWPVCTGDDVCGATSCSVYESAADAGDDGACAAHVWTTNAACDDCIRSSGCGDINNYLTGTDLQGTALLFPPCSALPRDKTKPMALSGAPATGSLRYDLCGALYSCVLGNMTQGVPGRGSRPINPLQPFYCGDAGNAGCLSGSANGPCLKETVNAYENTDPNYIINNLAGGPGLGPIGVEGREVANLFGCLVANCVDICFSTGLDGGHQ